MQNHLAMKKYPLILLAFVLAMPAMAQNSNDDLLHEGQARRFARKAAKKAQEKQVTKTTVVAGKTKTQTYSYDPKYWVGKVPVVDGKVTFERTIAAPGKTKSQLEEIMRGFEQQLITDSHNEIISHFDDQATDAGQVAATIGEQLYFVKKPWLTDVAGLYYIVSAQCADGQVKLRLNNIQYSYEIGRETGGENLKAEDLITDEMAINKKKNKFYKEQGKFRCATIDRMTALLDQASALVGAK